MKVHGVAWTSPGLVTRRRFSSSSRQVTTASVTQTPMGMTMTHLGNVSTSRPTPWL